MGLLAILCIVALIGAIMWVVNTYVRVIQQPYMGLINAIVLIVTLVWVAQQFGVFGGHVRVPKW